MKRITKLGSNRYIHLDTYKESLMSKFVMTAIVLFTAGITAGAIVGLDITDIKSTPTQQQTK